MPVFDHAPPPFFRRGPSPLALLGFYVALSIALFVLDLRFHALDILRQGISVVTDPLQRLAQSPLRLASDSFAYFRDLEGLQAENSDFRADWLALTPKLTRLQELEAENAHLRNLLELRAQDMADGQAARILYTARDPFTRRVYLDKGLNQGLQAGQPVIDTAGIVGQVTRVFPLSAEVTLLTDKDQAVPVQVLRTGQRSVTFGLGNGLVELKYIPANADVVIGDQLVTSGLDGVYPAGFAVATVTQVERDSAYAFARIIAMPVAAVESHNIIMVLKSRELPPSPETAIPEAAPKRTATSPRARPARASANPR
ncbi:MAG: rod shape-determining protein MreC [Zoogloeaceae bacterium]|nr:rod shape-determining protein MreC [Zoogloeaceae bacterium]